MILDGKNISEVLISGTALLKQAREKIDKNIKTTAELFELEQNNNILAQKIVEEFKKNLTVLLLNISSTINPDIIILGGGVIKSKHRFLQDVINNFKEKSYKLAKDTIIETTDLGELGILGAALFAKTKKNSDWLFT